MAIHTEIDVRKNRLAHRESNSANETFSETRLFSSTFLATAGADVTQEILIPDELQGLAEGDIQEFRQLRHKFEMLTPSTNENYELKIIITKRFTFELYCYNSEYFSAILNSTELDDDQKLIQISEAIPL